ncbi:signal recognition particle receptor subunit beta-like [Stegodyphus dumicola]|uniref:signal recognition particle receptor subunit beta-like n=1 Tax=Stegodyphus dumicola TaxID=202533 RepID=UPI0015A8AB10|nr:signal recognition particle receptor subunit beta-like [Stegodyphus dumicola]
MEPLKEYIGQIEYDVNFYAVISAILALLVTIVIFFAFRKKRVYRRSVLITGLSESGKTLLFSRLVSSKRVITYTSMKENIAVLNVPKKKPITVVDVPGNERLRFKYIEEFMPSARGIIFVIDSLTFQKEIRDVAGFLFTLLQEPFVHHYRIPFLIACNKQDHAVAKSAKVIQSQLEKEMNALRITQSGRLASVSSFEDKIFLGHKGKDFQFSDLKSIKVEFCECSALEPGEGSSTEILQSFWIWLSKIA